MKEKVLDFIEKRWRIVVIVVALLYIGIGVFQMVTGIEFDSSKMRSVEYVLMILVIFVFFYGSRKEKREKDKAKQEEDNQTIIEENIDDEDSE